MYREILVPLDGTPAAEAALPHATAVAGAVGARLRLVRSVMAPALVAEVALPPSVDLGSERRVVLEYLEALRDRLVGEGLAATAEVLDGPPGPAVLSFARREAVDLVVLATRGRRGLGRILHRNTARKIVAGCPCPVLVIRPPREERPRRGRRAP